MTLSGSSSRKFDCIDRQCLMQQAPVFVTRHLDRAELCQMVGQELGVEQPVTGIVQPGDQMDQGDLAGVGRRG